MIQKKPINLIEDAETIKKLTTNDDSFEEEKARKRTTTSNRPIRSTRRTTRRTSHPELKQCETILEELRDHQYSWPFKEPVDPVALKIPDYLDIIKHPIDLGTISKKLHQGAYTSVNGFAEDVRRVWSNAMLYNGPHSHIYFMAKTLSDIFEKKNLLKPLMNWKLTNPLQSLAIHENQYEN